MAAEPTPVSPSDAESDIVAGAMRLAAGVGVPVTAVRFQYSRAAGPGGQNVNKVNTRAELWVRLDQITGLSPRALTRLATLAARKLTLDGEIHLVSQIHRSQERNRQQVLEHLRQLVLQAMVEPKRRRKTRPSAGSRQRRLDAKKIRSDLKSRRKGHDA